MFTRRNTVILLALLWIIVGLTYLWASTQQKQRVNLSATAGGQYPYLTYAQGIARDGITGHFGDRNRLPLYPALLATVYSEDWDAFVEASSWLAIISSMLILAGIGCVGYRLLPPWPATALTLTAVVCVFIHKSSFVQAELLYYGLLFGTWLVMCRLLRRPDPRWAVLGGLLCGLTFLTKASGAAALAAYVIAAGMAAVIGAIQARRASDSNKPTTHFDTKAFFTIALVVLSFTAVAGSYLTNNKERYGTYFYNVNSTFFMWCDSWSEAQRFSGEHDLEQRYPDAPTDTIPGPLNYARSHTATQITGRLWYGVQTLGSLAWHGSYGKYFLATFAMCLYLGTRQPATLAATLRTNLTLVFFCGIFFGGYLLAYAWYAQVAYGDRFLLSLFLPGMFAIFWLASELSAGSTPTGMMDRQAPALNIFAGVCAVALMSQGAYIASKSLYLPSDPFVRFYYNESRELQLAGNLAEAVKGFEGVVRLRPDFAPAHHSLGMVNLTSGRFEEAVTHLTKAARLSPEKADVQNSLGSALIQTGRTATAIAAFERATQIDPTFATAWYNLGGSYVRHGEYAKAEEVRQQLLTIDPRLAQALAELMKP